MPRTASKVAPAKKDQPKKVDHTALVAQYTPYVKSIAGKVKKSLAREIEFDDLVEYGMIGLMEASSNFDPKYGVNFMTFSYYRIRGAIYDGLRGMGWLSRTEYARFKAEQMANSFLQAEQDKDAANATPVSKEQQAANLAETLGQLTAIFITSLDAAEGLQIKDERAENPEERVEMDQLRGLVRGAIGRLPAQERKLLEMYYYNSMTLEEIGEKFGLSKSWTSRLHAQAMEKLQRILSVEIRELELA